MSDDKIIKNRTRGKGKIKVVRRQRVDNLELVDEIIKFKNSTKEELEKKALRIKDAKKMKIPKHIIEQMEKEDVYGYPSERLGEIFMDLVDNYATKSSFSGYPFLEDMKSRAIFFLLKYSKSFNPEKSKNAFSYCTEIVHNAFIQVIKKEKKYMEDRKNHIEKVISEQKYDKKDDDLIFG
jgi:hypothetical protein